MPYHVRAKGRVSPPSASSALQEREAMLREVRVYASQQGLTPRPFAVEQQFGAERVVAVFRTPEKLLLEAKLLPQRFTPNELLAALRDLTARLGHPPTEAEVNADLSTPAAMVYRHHFGSLAAAERQVESGSFAEPISQSLLSAVVAGRGHRVRRKLSEAERIENQTRIQAGGKRWVLIRRAMKTCEAESWSLERFEASVRGIDPTVAEVLANLTHPIDGVRQGPKELVDRLSIRDGTNVRVVEAKLIPFCGAMNWPVALESEDARRRSEARQQRQALSTAVRELMAAARTNRWKIETFTERLTVLYPKVAEIFKNLTNPPDGARLSIGQVGKNGSFLGGNYNYREWEGDLEEFCEVMGWPVAPRTTGYQTRVRIKIEGQQRSDRVRAVEQLAREGHWTMDQFDYALFASDETVGAIFRNLRRPDGERLSQSELSDGLDLSKTTVVRWEKHLRGICRDMKWPAPEQRQRSGRRSSEGGGVVLAPDAEDMVARAKEQRPKPMVFVPTDETMCKPEPLTTPADLKKSEPLITVPVVVKGNVPGFAPTPLTPKDLATPPSEHRHAGPVSHTDQPASRPGSPLIIEPRGGDDEPVGLPLFIGQDIFLPEPTMGMMVLSGGILLSGVAVVAVSVAVLPELGALGAVCGEFPVWAPLLAW